MLNMYKDNEDNWYCEACSRELKLTKKLESSEIEISNKLAEEHKLGCAKCGKEISK